MMIHVSKDAENAINAAVASGQFGSAEDMVDRLVQEYRQRKGRHKRTKADITLIEDEIDRQMLADGLLTELPDTSKDVDDDDIEPVVIEGEPLSETIIRERR